MQSSQPQCAHFSMVARDYVKYTGIPWALLNSFMKIIYELLQSGRAVEEMYAYTSEHGLSPKIVTR
jgi:hypothetical protein